MFWDKFFDKDTRTWDEKVQDEVKVLKIRNHSITDSHEGKESVYDDVLPRVKLVVKVRETFGGISMDRDHRTFISFDGEVTNDIVLTIQASKLEYIRNMGEMMLSFSEDASNG